MDVWAVGMLNIKPSISNMTKCSMISIHSFTYEKASEKGWPTCLIEGRRDEGWPVQEVGCGPEKKRKAGDWENRIISEGSKRWPVITGNTSISK
jgi:hypothetical protein